MPDLYPLIRPLLFSLDAEKAHHLTLSLMRTADSVGMLSLAGGAKAAESQETGGIQVMGLHFPNRVGLAAGLDKAGTAVGAFGKLGFGHVEVGTVTPRSQPGNPKPRLFRLKSHEAIINRMGFNNPGTDMLLKNVAQSRGDFAGIVGINIGKNADTPLENALDDYLRCFEAVYDQADYVTANLSSPNTKGLRDLQNETFCRELITSLQRKRETLRERSGGRYVPLVIKIAPDLTGDAIRSLAEVFSETGIDGVIATNTTIARDLVADHPLGAEAGGLSGKPLTEKAAEALHHLRTALDPAIPVIASGGVMSGEDAKSKLDAGAALVQVYTGLIYRGPALIREIAALT